MATSQDFVNWVPTESITPQWIQLVFLAELEALGRFGKGAVHQTVYFPEWVAMHIALPPLAEQRRIVARVDELMALLHRLEAAQAGRERRRDRLAAASLHRLNQPEDAENTETVREHTRFYLQNMPRLVTRPEHVKGLRETVLNLAVRGKLTPQDPNDEPASAAIERIVRSGSGRSVRRGVPESTARPNGIENWSLPPTWECLSAATMLRLGVLMDLKDGNHGANHPKVAEFADEGVAFITAAQVRNHTLDLIGAYKVPDNVFARLRVGFAKAEDVILTHKGSVGRVAIAPGDCILSPQTTYYRPNTAILLNRYLMWFMVSTAFARQVDEVKKQTTRDFVPITRQYEFFHAIPPLAEQRRIVARVDELMAICDQLEAQLTQAQTDSSRLLEAVLHEALAQAETEPERQVSYA